MPGIIGGASRSAFSAAAVVLGGGLGLYQMTSLVLGPAPSRQVHLSLAMPAIAMSDPRVTETLVNHIGTLATAAVPTAPHQASGRSAAPRSTVSAGPVAAPVAASPPALPVASPPPAKKGSGHSAPPKRDDDH